MATPQLKLGKMENGPDPTGMASRLMRYISSGAKRRK